MPPLILINGPPSSGKSTLAARLVATRPLMLDLDVDVVRGMLGESHDRFVQFLETRPTARRITVIRGDIEATLRPVEVAVES